jgi:uncharacterized protein (TIGR03083 family)
MQQQVPISTVHLFPILDRNLIELLRSLTPEDWFRPTIAKKWQVKDIVAHLLDGNIRTLSLSRDKHLLSPNRSIGSYDELVSYLNDLNASWVEACKRISPHLLVELLEHTGKQFCEYLVTLDPWEDAIFSVAWAGEDISKNWFHVAREYTEKFIHQLQIRDAVNKPGLITHELYFPFIDTFMCALPHVYRNVPAKEGSTICVSITGSVGGKWYLGKTPGSWQLSKTPSNEPIATFTTDPETAWKLFSKGIRAEEARPRVEVTGELAEPIFNMLSVMA